MLIKCLEIFSQSQSNHVFPDKSNAAYKTAVHLCLPHSYQHIGGDLNKWGGGKGRSVNFMKFHK